MNMNFFFPVLCLTLFYITSKQSPLQVNSVTTLEEKITLLLWIKLQEYAEP